MQDHPNSEVNGLRRMGVWARRYAESRTLPVVVFQVIFLLLWCAYISITFLLRYAFVAHQWLVFGAGVCLLALTIAVNVWLAMPAWSGRWLERLGEQFYRREGKPTVAQRRPGQRR